MIVSHVLLTCVCWRKNAAQSKSHHHEATPVSHYKTLFCFQLIKRFSDVWVIATQNLFSSKVNNKSCNATVVCD